MDLRLQSATDDASFGDILSQFEESHKRAAERGSESRQGVVVAVSAESVFVDIGFKTEGILPVSEFLDASGKPDIKAGDQLVVSIKGRTQEGYYELSKIKVERPKDWSSLEKAFTEKLAIAGMVTGVIKGGLTVDVGVRAFLPASRSGTRDQAEMEQLVGQEITCRIIKLDVADEDVVVDRRAILEEQELRKKQEFLQSLREGDVVSGTVRTLTDFGAFLDIGGADALLHVSDISWGRVAKPADALKSGNVLEVKILKINPETRKISVGLKQMSPDPWTLVNDKYHTGERVHGKISRVVDFGAFVELEPGVEGLIHLSDLSWSRKVRRPSDVAKPGELVEVMIVNVNGADRRIGLSLKQALGDPWDEAAKQFPVGSVIEGKITSLAKFGAFVELAEGIEGMIHVGDITNEKRINHPQDVLKLGATVKAQVLEFEREKRRIRLGMKQLQPTSADEYIAEHKMGDVVTGRIVDVAPGEVKVELGEGLFAVCPVAKEQKKAAPVETAATERADVSSLSAMLSAKWKQGKSSSPVAESAEAIRAGQVRSFRITVLDPAQKRVQIEIVS